MLLLFVYGIFGIPERFLGQGAAGARCRTASHLGLDLKGGTHLILQVQVNDAVNVDTDNAIETLKSGMRNAKINYTDITKPDPANHPDQIVIEGCAARGEFRSAHHRPGPSSRVRRSLPAQTTPGRSP